MNARETLNAIYRPLEAKRAAVQDALRPLGLRVASAYYNGHYQKDEDGDYVRNDYPIPVVEVAGLCDIEIEPDHLSVSAKLTRERALAYDFSRLRDYAYEVYGVQDYLTDYAGEDVKETIRNSAEREIGFSFSFYFETDGETLCGFASFLREEGFYA